MRPWLALALACSLGCHSDNTLPKGTDVLLISLDTVRADALESDPTDGRVDMPALRALAEQSIWFVDAFAPMAFTLPSHMTLLTGVHPETHAVTIEKSALSPSLPLLAERFREAGYDTFGVVSGSWLKAGFGFARGFDRYEELPLELTFAPRVRQRVLTELTAPRAERSARRPRFVFAHFMDAHSDFSSADNELTYYSPPELRSDLSIPHAAMCDEQNRCATDRLRFADRERRDVAAPEIALHRELYRRGLRYLDQQVAGLFTDLDRLGVSEHLLVVVVSDHGEEFREHGKFLHSQVFRESLRVPLFVLFPAAHRPAPERRSNLVGLESVAPTLAARLGLAPSATWQGADLLAGNRTAAVGSPALLGQDKLVRTVYSLRTADRLFLWDFGTGSGRSFDLASDPQERMPDVDTKRASRALESDLFAALRLYRSKRPELLGRPGELFTDEERAQLRSLGYL